MIFNKRVMYTDRNNTTTRDLNIHEPMYAYLDDVLESSQFEELSESSSIEHSPLLRRSTRSHVPYKTLAYYVF